MGFDNECILNIQSLAGEYFCPVCRTLVYPNEALQSQCTHLYCKPCLAYVVSSTQACPYDGYLVTEAGSKPLVESNKVLAETIGKIAVHCLYHRSGCPWQGPLSECTSHCSGCAFGNSPVVCNRCGIQIVHRQVQEHAQTCNVNGANPQAQQGTENVQDAATSGAAVTMDQSKSATQPGVPTTQSQASQTVVGTPSGQNPNQQAITNPQSQAVPPTAVPTPEQWYQQQYQQYYQQYPGYDPYQQAYQQYYPYQQQATQQFQQHPPHVQGQAQSQPLPQVQPQAQQQIQQQVQLPTQPQLQPQPQPHPHPQTQSLGQPQIPPQGHPQPNLYSQAAVPVQNQNQVQGNPQQQIHPAVQPHAQVQSQTLQPPHGLLPPQSFPQAQPHQVQTHPQQQMPQYQQHPQMHHSQPLSQVHPHPQVQPQPHSQGQPQPQFQPHAQPHPQLQPSQPNMLQTPNAQPPVQSVTSHPQYPQPQAHQQMQQAPLQQQPMQIHPSTGSLPPGQVHGQFPQPPAHVRPPPFLPNQHQPALLSSQGQAPSITPAQHVHPHNQQPGLPVNQRPVMHPVQLPAPQQYVQPPQAFTGQLSGPVQGQLPQPGHFAPQQSQLRPQGPQAMQQHPLGYVQQQQHPLGYVQQQQSVAHGIQPQQSQNYMGRPVMQNHGLQSQQFPQSSGSLGVAPQPRPPQFGSAQQSVNQNYVNVNNQMQTSSDHQFIQSGVPANGAVVERKGDQTSERSVDQQESQSPSQKKSEKDANGLAVDSIETRSETGLKSMNDEHKPGSEVEENYRQEALSKDEVSEVYQMKGVSGDPVITQRVKEEDKDSTLEHSPGGRSVQNKSVDERDASGDSLKQGEKSAVNVAVQASTQADKGSLVVPPGNSQASLTGRDRLQSSHPVPLTDQGRPQLPPLPYGPSGHQQRPAFPPMSQPVPPTGPPLGHGQLPHPGQVLNPPEHFQPPVLKQSGSFNPEHALGGPSVPGPIAPFGRGPNHFGNHPRSFELQSVAPQGQYNQGHFPSAHAGLSRMSQGEPVGPPVGAIPPGSFEPQDGIMGRALLPRGPEGQIGPHRAITPMETETFSNHRPPHFDGRLPESHVPGALERGPFGHSFGVESNAVRMNGAPGLDSSPGLALRNDKFKTLTEERLDTFPMGPPQRRDQSEVHEGLKQFPRSPHLGSEASPKFGNNFFSSRPMDRGGFGMDGPSRSLDKGPPGFNFDAGQKLDPVSGGGPSGFLPPYHSGGAFQPNNSGGRTLPVGIHDDNRGRSDPNRTNPDFLGPVSGFGRHHMDRVPPRSPGRQYLGNQSRPFGSLSGVPHNIDGIDGRDTHPFGEGSRSFNHASESVGHSRHESRFPILPPGHMQRGDFDGPGNLRMGEHMRSGDLIGQDILSSHLRRGEVFGPRNLPSHPHLGEPGFGSFPGYGRLGESGGGPGGFPHHESFGESFGNKSSHPRLGEPGFRSSYSLQGFPNDGRYFAGDSDSFDKLRKRKPVSSGWCRICKVDCETVEGLDIHGQTREHQKMAMDMVISIKQKNSKKQKTSNDHAAREDGSKSRNVGFQGRGNKP